MFDYHGGPEFIPNDRAGCWTHQSHWTDESSEGISTLARPLLRSNYTSSDLPQNRPQSCRRGICRYERISDCHYSETSSNVFGHEVNSYTHLFILNGVPFHTPTKTPSSKKKKKISKITLQDRYNLNILGPQKSGSLDAVEPIHRPSQPSRKSSLAGSAALSSSPPKRSKDPDSNAPRTSSIPSQDPDYESGESTPTRPCKHSRLSSKGKSHSRPRGEIHQPRSQLSSIYVQSEDDQDTPTPPLPNSYMGESFGLFLGLFFNYRSHQRTQQPASKA